MCYICDIILLYFIQHFRHNLRHKEKNNKKITHAGSLVSTTLPACYIYHFTLQIHKSSAQNYQNAEDTALLYYIEAQKIAAELAAKSKYFLCSNHRTLEALKTQISGYFIYYCRYFLQHYYRDTFIESHRKPIEVLEISYSGRLIRSQLYLSCQIQTSGISDKLFGQFK